MPPSENPPEEGLLFVSLHDVFATHIATEWWLYYVTLTTATVPYVICLTLKEPPGQEILLLL